MKKFLMPIASVVMTLAVSCAANAAPSNYTVTVDVDPDDDGSTAFIVNYDTGEKIDSAVVADGKAKFSGQLENPALVRLLIDGQRAGTFILEQGDIRLGEKVAAGTPLNQKMDELSSKLSAIEAEYAALPGDASDETRQALIDRYDGLMDETMEANMDNPIGYYLFLQKGMELTLPELEETLAKYPQMAKYQRMQKMLASARIKEATSEGKPFVDFTVESPDGIHKLSDYVGKGKPVLVDFWASWCGPCRREMPTLKRIYNEFGASKGLEVLGVAVWDEVPNTLKAIEELQLPWPQIIDAKTVPTDAYGIEGIPCIILFGPDGTILVRGKQGEDLYKAVSEALNN